MLKENNISRTLTLVHPYGHFCPFQFFFFFDHFACVKANGKKNGTGVYFYFRNTSEIFLEVFLV